MKFCGESDERSMADRGYDSRALVELVTAWGGQQGTRRRRT
jgi:hypothetical protein